MRILIGSNVHWWNAEAEYAATIANLLKRAGHSVFVLTRPASLNERRLKELGLNLVTEIPKQIIDNFIKNNKPKI